MGQGFRLRLQSFGSRVKDKGSSYRAMGYVFRWEGSTHGVNHCSLHCRLAKFRSLRRRGKYGAVIG
jgi:hypothetical protein